MVSARAYNWGMNHQKLRFGQGFHVAFGNRRNAACAAPIGDVSEFRRQGRERRRCDAHASQRIPLVRIETG